MYTNTQILTGLNADKYLALTLDKSLSSVNAGVLEQAEKIKSGATRAIYYLSCFKDYYKDVCEKQKSEDIRFSMSLVRLAENKNVINLMIQIYTALLLQNYGEHHDISRIQRLAKMLAQQGAKFATNNLTKQGLSAAITSSATYSFSLNTLIERNLFKYSTWAVSFLGLYGVVQDAANAADRLKQRDSSFYYALYHEKLEMLYFLIEKIIERNPPIFEIISSDKKVAEAIIRITS